MICMLLIVWIFNFLNALIVLTGLIRLNCTCRTAYVKSYKFKACTSLLIKIIKD